MNELMVKLRILARAEVTLFKADAQRRTNQAILAAVSIGCVFVALIFVNMGAFFTLIESEVDSRAAFILAGVNAALAVVPFLLRRQARPGPEEVMVREIREMAATEVSKDIQSISEEISAVGDGIKQLKSGISAFSGGGGGGGMGGAIGVLGPVLPLVIDMLKKSKK